MRRMSAARPLNTKPTASPPSLLRTDMRNSRAFQNAVMLLRALGEGRTVSADASLHRTRCPKCGTPYRHNSTVCPHCIDRKKLLRRLWPFAKPSMKPLLVAVLLFFAVSALDVVMPILNRILIDDYINKPGASTSGFFAVIAAIVAVLASGALFCAIRSVLMVKTGNRIVVRVREAVYAKAQAFACRYYEAYRRRADHTYYERHAGDARICRGYDGRAGCRCFCCSSRLSACCLRWIGCSR